MQPTAPRERTTSASTHAGDIPLKPKEYESIRQFIYDAAGIDLGPAKQMLVTARLRKRLRHYNLTTYGAYYNLVHGPDHPGERQQMIDLLTTNETYFFRENDHFEFLKNKILPAHNKSQKFRLWSAASSSGEEAYSIAMLLADQLGNRTPWEIMGSDISTQILEKARAGHYSLYRTEGIPRHYLQKYCLKGTGPYDGTLLISPELRKRCFFQQINLIKSLPDVGRFDVIFLRNVLIYFDNETKESIVNRLSHVLRPGGFLMIGHSESLKGLNTNLHLVAPTTYQKT